MPKVLIDTNILLYSVDPNEPLKQERALHLLSLLGSTRAGVLSVQNLAEFTNGVLKRLRPPLSPVEALQQVRRLKATYTVLDLTAAIVLEAARGVRDYRLSYYDAQLWATARVNQIEVIFSEDFAASTALEGVRFVNPLAENFDPAAWL
jgi:predicted nucleic acid-binding protein